MFTGRHQHNIDDKGRMIIPARYRENVNHGAYVTLGFDQNLMVLTPEAFEQLAANVNRMSLTDPSGRDLRRYVFSSAEFVELDKVGRILLPQYLRELAGLQNEVMLVGSGDYFEIWDLGRWMQKSLSLNDPEANRERFAVYDLRTH